MKKTNLFSALFTLVLVLSVGLGCGSLSASKDADAANTPADETKKTADVPKTGESAEKNNDKPKAEKADFTLTAEELDKEFTREGVTDKDLEKYAGKIIAVSGRVSMLVTEKKDSVKPWVTLFAPGVLHGVSCYFDDENVDQMKMLKMNKKATVQGFQNDFIVPEVSPRLENCVVIEAE